MSAQIVDIVDYQSGSTARVLISTGFNCFSWRPVLEDGPREMLWALPGFETGDKRPSSSGIPLLFPFPGRIGGTTFQFESRDYALKPGDAFGNAIHGFVFDRPWRVIEHEGARVIGEFQASIDDATILEHWPADFRIRVSYEVRRRELVSDIEYKNMDTRRLPCGFGTHAYFRLPLVEGGYAADTVVKVPAHQFWELDKMIPTGQVSPVKDEHALARGLRLADHQFDTEFTDLRPDADGQIQTSLRDPSSRRTLMQSFDSSFTQCVVYTPPHREAICIEPYTCVPHAFHLAAKGHITGLQILNPGESRRTTIRIALL